MARGRRSSLLRHPRREALDKALQTDRTLRDIAAEFDTSKDALARYRHKTLIPSLHDEPICVQARADLVTIRKKLAQEPPAVTVPLDLAEAAVRADLEPEMETVVGEVMDRAPFLPALYHEPVDPVAVLDEAVAIAARTMRGAERVGESYLAIAGAVAVGRLVDKRVEWAAKWGVSGDAEVDEQAEAFNRFLEADPDVCPVCSGALKTADGLAWLASEDVTSEQRVKAFRHLAKMVTREELS